MALPNIFTSEVTDTIIARIDQLKSTTPAGWGKMDVAQMLAHCNVSYELVYEDKHPKPNFLMGLILRSFIKKVVTSETPYKQNSPTAPAFVVKSSKDFNI